MNAIHIVYQIVMFLCNMKKPKTHFQQGIDFQNMIKMWKWQEKKNKYIFIETNIRTLIMIINKKNKFLIETN